MEVLARGLAGSPASLQMISNRHLQDRQITRWSSSRGATAGRTVVSILQDRAAAPAHKEQLRVLSLGTSQAVWLPRTCLYQAGCLKTTWRRWLLSTIIMQTRKMS